MSAHNYRMRIERALGDPSCPNEVLSHANAMAYDEEDRFPKQQIDHVSALGLGVFPPDNLWHFEEMMEKTSAIARRDLSVAIAMGVSLLGALPVLIAGRNDQVSDLLDAARAGKMNSLALTERSHGSDLAATKVTAHPNNDKLIISGTKWLIGNGTRSTKISALIRVEEPERPATAVVYFDRDRLRPGSLIQEPKIKTHGIRGADVSGFTFKRCEVPKSSIVGKVGRGFEIVGKSLQISRILCCGFSLGAADTALKSSYEFAKTRHLYGSAMLDMKVVRHSFVTAFVQLLICEAVSRVAHRSLHTHVGDLALISAISKAFVPDVVDEVIRTSAKLLGARYYLREDHKFGIFQKLKRDHEVISLFDGSTAVNLSIIASHLPALAYDRTHGSNDADAGGNAEARRLLFDVSHPLKATKFPTATRLMLSTFSDPVLISPQIVKTEIPKSNGSHLDQATQQSIKDISRNIEDLDADVLKLKNSTGFDPKSPSAFLLAKKYCNLFAAMCCVRLWAASATTSGTLLSRPEWLQVALSLLLDKASVDDPDTDATILAALDEFTSEDLPLSLLTPVSPNFRA